MPNETKESPTLAEAARLYESILTRLAGVERLLHQVEDERKRLRDVLAKELYLDRRCEPYELAGVRYRASQDRKGFRRERVEPRPQSQEVAS